MKSSFESSDAIKAVQTALLKTHELWYRLGEAGKNKRAKNQFGDTALEMDIGAEEEMIAYFTSLSMPLRVFAEEHAFSSLVPESELLAIMDGLDGSSVYLNAALGDPKSRYGTMCGLFAPANPRYNDYFASGVMEHPTGRLFIAARDSGAFELDTTTGERQPISVKAKARFTPDAHLYVNEDRLFPGLQDIAHRLRKAGFKPSYTGSTAVHLADVASGTAIAALEATRKNNLEFGAAYGLIREAGGTVLFFHDGDWQPLGPEVFCEFGQQPHERIPLLAAANQEIATELRQFMG